MIKIQNPKKYDLEERTLIFSKEVLKFIKCLPKTIANIEVAKQLTRAAGSVGANYIEANESLGRKDFLMRIRISRKEAKESRYWLELTEPNSKYNEDKGKLIKEATELMKIFGSIVEKARSRK